MYIYTSEPSGFLDVSGVGLMAALALLVAAHVLLLLLLVSREGRCSTAAWVAGEAMFVFGDSLSDPGNNNHMETLAKGNYAPHGIDFPGGATGRFCNGFTVPDHLGNLLWLGVIPAYSDPSTHGSNLLKGVNFASSAAGILNQTGDIFGGRLSMEQQLEGFTTKTLPDLRSQSLRTKGGEELSLEEFLAKSLIFCNIGTNDYIINYLLKGKKFYTLPDYTDMVINQYRRQLHKLYQFGARKFLIAGVGPVGCMPFAILYFRKNASTACAEKLNQWVLYWNAKLRPMLQQLNHELSGAYFLYWDVYAAFQQIIGNPSHYGFKDLHSACCGAGRQNSEVLCLPKVPFVCPDRSEYVFWDSFHPSHATNGILAKQAFEGTIQNTFPMNVQQLLQL